MNRLYKKTLSLLLVFLMLAALLPAEAMAHMVKPKGNLTFTDGEGNVISVDESWTKVFPYGTFAFSANEATAEEGGGAQKITVYRLGGTSGRAHAYITYTPAYAQIEEEEYSYANAAGKQDVIIEVEDPLPFAKYQPLGKEPEPKEPDPQVGLIQTYDGEEGSYSFSLETGGRVEEHQWYAWHDGAWSVVSGATDQELVVEEEYMPDKGYDYMCVYTVDGVRYGSNSAAGDRYVKPEEDLGEEISDEELAELLSQDFDTTYSTLPMDDEDEFASYIFEMVFADGEWVKDILITAPDDGLTEADEFGLFTIAGCLGGSLYDSANTLALQVVDAGEPGSTEIGFTLSKARFDKAEGSAFLTVRRTGDKTYPVSFDWAASDGTAEAGVDYAASSGTLIFYAAVDELEIEIPLIDGGVATEEEKYFTVELSNLLGGLDGLASFGVSRMEVRLFNSGTGDMLNLPTLLYDAESVDVSSSVVEADGGLVPAKEAVTGKQTNQAAQGESSALYANIGSSGKGGISPMSHSYGRVSFSRGPITNYKNLYWTEWLRQYDRNGSLNYSDMNSVGAYGWKTSGGAVGVDTGRGFGIYTNDMGAVSLDITNASKLFSNVTYYWYAQHRMNYDKWYLLNPNLYIGPAGLDIYLNPKRPDEGTYQGSQWDKIRKAHDKGETNNLDYYWLMSYPSNRSGTAPININSSSTYIALQLHENPMNGYKTPKPDENWKTEGIAESSFAYLALQRRNFTKDLSLRIYTANDADVVYGADGIPENVTILDQGSDLYNSLKPNISITQGQGGINTAGRLFVGSRLQVSMAHNASFRPAQTDNPSATVFLTQVQSDGSEKVVATSTLTSDEDVRNLDLIWNNLNVLDLSADYFINVVLERRQDIVLELGPSVQRLENGTGINPEKLPEAYAVFQASGGASGITAYYAKTGSVPSGSIGKDNVTRAVTFTAAVQNKALDASMPSADGTAISLGGYSNLYAVNFNRSPEDMILFNGVAYKGNEAIQIPLSALSNSRLVFRYYNKDYLTALSTMTTLISDVCLYLDVNGNGELDGYFDTGLNTFVLDAGKDEVVGYLDPKAYEENHFAPVWNEDLKKYVNHFVAIEYTMTPRCLMVPPGGSENDRAQALTAITTGATDPGTLLTLSREQQSYRYVESGAIRIDGTRVENSSDNRPMYGAGASSPGMVYFSAGGDQSPPKRKDFKSGWTWDPNFKGSLMYDFDNPAPVAIKNSVTGSNIQIARLTGQENGSYQYETGGVEKLNGYLGSLSGLDTFALTVQQQVHTTAQLMEQVITPVPESSSLGGVTLFPNGDYLSDVDPGTPPSSDAMDSSGKGDYAEFGVDMGVKLPTLDIGLSDYLTIVMDGYDIGFAIGLPLASFESKKTGNFEEAETKNPRTANEDNVEKFQNFFTGKWGQLLKDDSLQSAMDEKASPSGTGADGNPAVDPGQMKSSSISVSLSLRIAFMFTYNPLDNGYYFSKFAVSVAGAFEYRYQYRFTPVPIVYVYFKVGVGLELATGLTVKRIVEEDVAKKFNLAEFTVGSPSSGPPDIDARPVGSWKPSTDMQNLITGQTNTLLEFTAGHKAYNVYFSGKLLVRIWDGEANDGAGEWKSSGFISSSDAGKATTIILAEQDGFELMGSDRLRVRLVAMDYTQLTGLVPVANAQSLTYWNGMRLAPSAFIEAGAGVGVELLKFELFMKISIAFAMTMGAYNEDAGNISAFSFDEFSLTAGIGFRVVLLFFNIEKEVIQYMLSYQKGRQGGGEAPWMHGYSALAGAFGTMVPLPGQDEKSRFALGSALDMSALGSGGGVTLKMPGSTYGSQKLYAQTGGSGGMSLFSYDATDAPFQISSYSTSGDAFKLADGLVTGYDYEVVTAGDKNYLIYTISRENAKSPVDYTMLVMSEIDLAKNGSLKNPVDGAGSDPYILLDTKASGEDDGAGDLEFSAWTEGNTIHAAWISYAEPSKMPEVGEKPDGDPYGGMTEENYQDIEAPVAPDSVPEPAETMEEPDEVGRPDGDEIDEEPNPNDYITDEYPDGTTNPEYEADLALYEEWESYRAYLDEYEAYEANRTAWEEYNDYLDDYNDYQDERQDYDAWYAYFASLGSYNDYVRNLLANSAKNTVVKTASFDTASGTGFTEAEVVGAPPSLHTFLPAGPGAGDVLFYASANHYTPGELAQANSDYEAYLRATYGPAYETVGAYQLEYQKSINAVYGKSSNLNVAAKDGEGNWVTTSLSLGADPEDDTSIDRRLENLEMIQADGIYYLAYTTLEQYYVGGELVSARRFFLRTMEVNDEGKASFGTPYLLRTIVNYDASNDRDGVVKGGSVSEHYADPYFANLQFLNAKLGSLTGEEEVFTTFGLDDGKETFLLFEMNGNTFVIPQEDLASITGEGKGRIIPFFTMETYPSTNDEGDTVSVDSTTTGFSNVTIGADGDGNIAAVYTATVPGTTNNALYISNYYTYQEGVDIKAGWSPGQMLAMNGMQVYEDSVTYSWDQETTEAAYLEGIVSKKAYDAAGDKPETATQFVFSNLRFALGKAGGDDGPAEATVISEGALTKLVEEKYELAEGYTLPNGDDSYKAPIPAEAAQVGFYAIAFGHGSQAIGNSSIRLAEGSLKAGSQIEAKVSFENVGDTRIRASEAQPVTVELKHHSGGSGMEYTVAQWEIEKSILPGQPVTLFGMAGITADAKAGDYFYFTVSEDEEYIGSGSSAPLGGGAGEALAADAPAFAGSGAFFGKSTVTDDENDGGQRYALGRYIVEELPDLGFESMSITSVGVSSAGKTKLQADFYVSNRGTKDAEGVFVQFSRQTGVDSQGDPAYEALDLTDSDFEISNQQPKTLFSMGAGTDLANGVLRLESTEANSDGDDINVGFGRHVKGTFYASPEDYFVNPVTGARTLNVRVRVFSGSDVISFSAPAGLYAAQQTGELYDLNNERITDLGDSAWFSAADQIAVPLGNTLMLPVSISTTRSGLPDITVSELRHNDVTGEEENHLGILYYDPAIKCIVITPSSEGSGVIRIADTATGGMFDIAFTVTEAGEGINIYDDNTMFSFYNSDRKDTAGRYNDPYDSEGAGQKWDFIQAPEWGDKGEAPYLSNLAKGEKGALFTFDTVASAIDIYFAGEISVDSTYPGFAKKTGIEARGGNTGFVTVDFAGSEGNTSFFAHTVTVTVTSQTPTVFDKYVEDYANLPVPTPADDVISPQIYWSRSFPGVASLKPGDGVELTCYIIDDTGLASVTLNGQEPASTIQESAGFWRFTWRVAENGAYTVRAADIAGNITSRTVQAGWFIDGGGTEDDMPPLTVGFTVGNSGEPWAGGPIDKDADVLLEFAAGSGRVSVDLFTSLYDEEDGGKIISAEFVPIGGDEVESPISIKGSGNGIYRVTVTDDEGRWRSVILYMDGIDTDLPKVLLSETQVASQSTGETVPALYYTASKGDSSAAVLKKVAINGRELTVSAGSRRMAGIWPEGGLLYGGQYILYAEDTAGNSATSEELSVTGIPVDASAAFTVTSAWNQKRNNGSVLTDVEKIGGGKYDPAVLATQGVYKGLYEYAFITGEAFEEKDTSSMTDEERIAWEAARDVYFDALTWETATGRLSFTDLTPGRYAVYIRDAQEPENMDVEAFSIKDEAVSFTALSTKARSRNSLTGSIAVTASGGKGGNETWQFALLPLEKSDSPLVEINKISETTEWINADDAGVSLSEASFSGLASGWYQAAVRGMYGVSGNTMAGIHEKREFSQLATAAYTATVAERDSLIAAKEAWEAAAGTEVEETAEAACIRLIRDVLSNENADMNDYDSALIAANDAVTRADAERNSAEENYQNALEQAESVVNTAYAADPGLWDSAVTRAVYVDYKKSASPAGDTIGPEDLIYDKEAGTVLVQLSEDQPALSDEAQQQLIEDNKTLDILIRGNGLSVVIPRGTLSRGDDINDMLAEPDGTGSGGDGVVAYYDKKGNVHIVAFSIVTGSLISYIASSPGRYVVIDNNKQFGDIAGHWAEKSILFATARELFAGTDIGRFSPDVPMTRAMFVTVLGRLAGVDQKDWSGSDFNDVPAGQWYSAFVRWAAENDIVAGYGNGRFGPDDPIDREQMCVMFVRFMRYMGIATGDPYEGQPFADEWRISVWAREEVKLCRAMGLIAGVGDNRFDPRGLATRAQVAAMFERLIHYTLKK